MDRLAAQGARFDDARSPAPLTLPAHATMLTGLPPARHGVRGNASPGLPPRADRPFATLPERLADAGWRCAAFVSAAPVSRARGLAHGFEAYDDEGVERSRGPRYAERSGPDTVGRALSWLSRVGGARVFLWVHLFEPHEPHPPGGYDADVAAADAAVGNLLDGLDAAGRGDAAVLLAADHGEALGEEGEATHGLLLGESVLRVPLLLKAPGVRPGSVRTDPADLADVLPTCLAVAGVADADAARGVGGGLDLRAAPAPAGRVRVAEGLHAHHQFGWAQVSAAVAGGWKLLDLGEGRERLHRLHDQGPPWQGPAVPAAGRPEAEPLADALRAYRRGERAAGSPPSSAPAGYGAGGVVPSFLDPAKNARLLDPYFVAGDAVVIWALESRVGHAPPDRLLEGLRFLETRDPGNPALAFLRGRVERDRAARATTDAARAAANRAAADAFRRALDLGREDEATVLLAAGSLADAGDRAAALALLDAWRSPVPPDVDVLLLEAALARDTGDGARRERACGEARRRAATDDDRRRVAEACGG
jgi:hypothetical protein